MLIEVEMSWHPSMEQATTFSWMTFTWLAIRIDTGMWVAGAMFRWVFYPGNMYCVWQHQPVTKMRQVGS